MLSQYVSLGSFPFFFYTNHILKAFYNIIFVNSYGPLTKALPLSIIYEKDQEEKEAEKRRRQQGKISNDLDRVDTRDSLDTYDTHETHSTYHTRPSNEAGPSFPSPSNHPSDHPNRKEPDYSNYYYHPARGAPQRTIWIPSDGLGLGDSEKQKLLDMGIDASTRKAEMDSDGKVTVTGPPPGRDLDEEETA